MKAAITKAAAERARRARGISPKIRTYSSGAARLAAILAGGSPANTG